jgi:hypothetical protein
VTLSPVNYCAFQPPHIMGIETILIVLGVAAVIAIAVGASRAKRKASGTQAPKTTAPSSVRPRE